MLKCPLCGHIVETRPLRSVLDDPEEWYHLYICDACWEPFMTEERYMPKEKMNNFKKGTKK